jgi:hypothetical protein
MGDKGGNSDALLALKRVAFDHTRGENRPERGLATSAPAHL